MKNKKQKGILTVFLLCVCFFISGCITRIEKEQKRKDLEYILIDQEHLPEEMTEVLGQLKKKHFILSTRIRERHILQKDTVHVRQQDIRLR